MKSLTKILPDKQICKPTYVLFAVVFVQQFINLLYSAFETQPPAVNSLLQSFAFLWAICWWFEAEIRRAKSRWPMDTGILLYAAWFVFLPVYLIKTRGVSGLIGIAGFVVSAIAGWLAAALLIVLVWY